MRPELVKDKSLAESVVLVNEADCELGTKDRMEAHIDGALHRALSVFVFNSEGRLLLTRRAACKYHSGGLWTNTCCTHPWPGEPIQDAAHRCLRKEIGIDCEIFPAFHFIYQARLANGLTEHELDHVFVATYDGELDLDPSESDAYEWVDPRTLGRDIEIHPEKYTAWLPLSLDRAVETQRVRRIATEGASPGPLLSGSFSQAAAWRIEGLWKALHGTPCPGEMKRLALNMLAPWGNDPLPDKPPWRSDIGDDHSPFEYSVAFSGNKAELRLLVEGQGGSDWASIREANLRLNETVEQLGADVRRMEQLFDLLLPQPHELEDPLFLLWHTVALTPGPPRIKGYLNPKVRGVDNAVPLIKAAFERLGLPTAWRTYEEAQRRLKNDDISLFCLDLEDTPSARVKVYSLPGGATAHDIERAAQLGPRYVPGEVLEFCRAMTGSEGPYMFGPQVARVPDIYFAFTRDEATPSDVTVQIPVRFFAANDAVVRDRVTAYLRSRGCDPALYTRALDAVSKGPLDQSRGLNAWVSLRTGTNPPLVTVYFSAELYNTLQPLEDMPVATEVQDETGT